MNFQLRLDNDQQITLTKPAVMGIVNVSPNSFFNPHYSIDAVLQTVDGMVKAGATFVDIGGEASNPNVNMAEQTPDVQQELDRVIPAISAVKQRFDVLISVDTRRAAVMQEAVAAGAAMINDQRNLSEENALSVAAALKTPVCLMHFFTKPRVTGSVPYADLLQQIKNELLARVDVCLQAGITRDRIILDPGFGRGHYAKNTDENFYLLAKIAAFVETGFPVLSGWSRKSMIGETLDGVSPEQRLFGTVAADTLAAWGGAHILRSHQVQAAVDTAKIVRRAAAFREFA